MASLAFGSFLDGALPKHDVVATADGGLAATVAQGAPALALWSGLKSIQHLRAVSVKQRSCRGGGSFTGTKAIAGAEMPCRWRRWVRVQTGPGGVQGAGRKAIRRVCNIYWCWWTVEPFATGANIVGAWKPGVLFEIEQEGCSRPAAGMVVDVILGLGGKKTRHKFLEGGRIAVKDVNAPWMNHPSRRPNHLVRLRQLVCKCNQSCTVRVEELYSYHGVTHGRCRSPYTTSPLMMCRHPPPPSSALAKGISR